MSSKTKRLSGTASVLILIGFVRRSSKIKRNSSSGLLGVRDPQENWQSVENLIKFEAEEKEDATSVGLYIHTKPN